VPASDHTVCGRPSWKSSALRIAHVRASNVHAAIDQAAARDVASGHRRKANGSPRARNGSIGARKRGPGDVPPYGSK
jgi:hypothetical protein